MKQPALTVILPVRNSEAYLEPALASLAAQTRRDFFVHAWDDGSTDATAEILLRWIPDRLPGRVLGHEPLGIGPALARLVESAPTDLIARMDGDDLCHPKRLEKQLSFMAEHPEVAVLGTQMQRRNQTLKKNRGLTQHPTRDPDLRWAIRLGNPINHPTVMMRKMAVLDCGNYRDLRPGQDDDLWLRIAYRHRMANLPDPLLIYREHSQSTTGKHAVDAVKRFRDRRLAAASIVFPGLEATQASRLTHLLTDTSRLDVTRKDIDLLHAAAERAATLSDEDPSYFQATGLFRDQLANFKIRRLKSRPIVRPAWPIIRGLARLTAKTTTNRPNKEAA